MVCVWDSLVWVRHDKNSLSLEGRGGRASRVKIVEAFVVDGVLTSVYCPAF